MFWVLGIFVWGIFGFLKIVSDFDLLLKYCFPNSQMFILALYLFYYLGDYFVIPFLTLSFLFPLILEFM